ncbi:MAG: MarC family protein [Flavobacteriia bacterium]|jgi:multiple antibiotic resistance protein
MMNFFNGFSWSELFKTTTVLFAVIDVVGSVPIILKIKESAGELNAARTSFASFCIMIGFLILGENILKLFGVTIESFAVAGSLILFAMALEMILGIKVFRDEVTGKTASIVPLAFPIIAGAGTMTTLVSLKAEFDQINIVLAIVINVIIIFAVLKMTKRIEQLLGVGGIAIIKKVFGIILLAIAIKLFTTNLQALF